MWCIWCSARSPAPSCLPVLRSDCPRVATWRLSGGRRVILGGAAKTRGPVRQSLSGEFGWRQGCRSRTRCRMVHLLRWVTHLNRRIISSVFVGYSTAHVFVEWFTCFGGEAVVGGSGGCLEARGWYFKLQADVERSLSLSSGGGGFARHPPLPATLCKVCFFLRNAKMCLQAHSPPPPAGLEEEGGKIKSAS